MPKELTRKETYASFLSSKDITDNLSSYVPFNTVEAFKRAVRTENRLRQKIHDAMPFGLERDIVNLEELYETDRNEGKGFVIDTSISYTQIDNESLLIDSDSIFSHKFSLRSNDTTYAMSKRFRCGCGKLESDTAGIMCPYCGEYTKDRPATRGWIVLNNFKVFNPYYLELLIKYLKKGINKTAFKADLYSFKEFALNKEGDKIPRTCKYNILDLQNPTNLKDFIEEYVRPEDKNSFLTKLSSAMTNKIPVINRDYRHYSITKKLNGKNSVASHPTNKLYIQIANAVNSLNRFSGKESKAVVVEHLSKVNKNFFDLKEELISVMADSKKADIRAKIGSRRLRNSARIVLEGLMTPHTDECTIPYRYFGTMTIDEHMEIYFKYGLTPEAEFRIRHSHPNENDKMLMIKVLNELKEKMINVCVVSRSPTIYRESIVALRIIGLSNDATVRLNEVTISYCLSGDKDKSIHHFLQDI